MFRNSRLMVEVMGGVPDASLRGGAHLRCRFAPKPSASNAVQMAY